MIRYKAGHKKGSFVLVWLIMIIASITAGGIVWDIAVKAMEYGEVDDIGDEGDPRTDEIKDLYNLADIFKLIEEIFNFILLIMLIQLRQAVSVSSNDTGD